MVAVGAGTNTISTSPDGITWTGRGASVFTTAGYGVAWNGAVWVAVGAGTNTLAISTDGVTWTGLGTSIFSGAGRAVAWNGLMWVAVGNGTNTTAWSYDGITWTAGTGTSFSSAGGFGVAWNGTRWVAVGGTTGDGSSTRILYSADGKEWAAVPFGAVMTGGGRGVAWNGSAFIAVGGWELPVATSVDGLDWYEITPDPFTNRGWGIAWGGTLWIAVGENGEIKTSSDGSTWTTQSYGLTTGHSVAWNGSVWVAGGTSGSATLVSSPNASSWTTRLTTSTMSTVWGLAARRVLPFVGQSPVGFATVRTDDGLETEPSHSFRTDPAMGMYYDATDQLGFSVAGVRRAMVTPLGLAVRGSAAGASNAVNAVGGGTFSGPVRAGYLTGVATSPDYSFTSDASAGIFFPTANVMGFATAGLERMRISNANVGIGTTTPQFLLDVSGGRSQFTATTTAPVTIGTSTSLNALVFQTPAASRRWGIQMGNSETGANAGADFFLNRSDDTGTQVTPPAFVVQRSSGYVGLGITAPTVPLDVSSGVNVGVLIRGTAGQSNAGLQFNNGTTNAEVGLAGVNGAWSGNSLAGDLVLRAAANQRLILHASGVGGPATFVISNSNVGFFRQIAPRFGYETNTQTTIPAIDISGQIYGRLPVFVVSGTSVDISANFNAYANSYFYITNSGFTTISNPPTTSTSQGGTFFQFKNATSSYLSITVASTVTITSPVVIPPSNAITLVVSPSNANTFLLF